MDLSFLTNKEVECFEANNLLTDDEKIILYHLRKQDKNDIGIRLELNLCNNKYYNTKKNLIEKLIRTGLN